MKERRQSGASEAPYGKMAPQQRPPSRPRRRRERNAGGILAGMFMGLRGAIFCAGFSVLSVSLIVWAFFWPHDAAGKIRAISPLPVPKVLDLAQFQGKHKESLFWGTYRPHLYFGIRSRTPKSLLAGLMWLGVKDGRHVLRHVCEDSDNLSQFGWLRHDGSTYGRQKIVDQEIVLSTYFLKSWDQESGYGGDWSVRIKVESASKVVTESRDASSIFFYVVNEDGGAVNILGKESLSKGQVPFATGHDVEYGNWELHLKKKTEAQVNFAGIHTSFMHNLTQLIWRKLEIQGRSIGRLQLSDDSQKLANMAIFQRSCHCKMPDTPEVKFVVGKMPDTISPEITGQLPLELDIVFVSEVQENHSKARVQKISGVGLDNLILEREHAFEKRFQEAFHLKEKIDDERILEVGRAALSNLVGGIGYFYGQSYIAVPSQIQGQDHWNYWSAALYTAVPCRSVFPRGFLWDEGFHQLIISRWDRNISRDIIGNWLDLMNEDGWIPREQILGAEARSKVPEEFILQRTDNANPPTLFLSLHEVASALVHGQGDEPQRKKETAFLQRSFPRLQAWFEWLNTTQKGRRLGSYFWHGRELATDRELNPKTLSSGLDDFPRASHPSIDERHLDLRCWMALGAKTMALIARIIGAPYEAYEATSNELASMKKLNELHYDSLTGRYYDYGNHSEKVQLQRKFFQDPQTGYVQSMLTRDVLRQPKLQFVPHFGYVSLFPFIMKLIPSDSPILRKQLELIHNEDLLWSDHGLRSLATTSSLYMKHNTEHDPPYWRGSVWINLNYLILSALHHYSQEKGPYSSTANLIYTELRENLIRNIVKRFYESGYLWEQYDNMANGKGKGAHPFTGWTSLVLLIMGENYV